MLDFTGYEYDENVSSTVTAIFTIGLAPNVIHTE